MPCQGFNIGDIGVPVPEEDGSLLPSASASIFDGKDVLDIVAVDTSHHSSSIATTPTDITADITEIAAVKQLRGAMISDPIKNAHDIHASVDEGMELFDSLRSRTNSTDNLCFLSDIHFDDLINVYF